MSEVSSNDLVENVEVTVQDAQLISYAVDANLAVAGAAADAKAVGDRFAIVEGKTASDIPYDSEHSVKDVLDDLADNTGADIAVSSTDNTSIANKFGEIEDSLFGTQIHVSSGSEDTIAEALAEQDGKTGADILYTSNGDTIKNTVDGINTRVGAAETAISGINTTISGLNAVKYTEQSLTNAQKQQARENIGAVTGNEVVTLSEQTLTSAQKTTVRTKLDLGDAATKGVVNDLTADSAGYVLDARQGKTLSDSISSVASDLSETDTAVSTLNTILSSLFRKVTYEFAYDSLASGSNKSYSAAELGMTEITGYTPIAVHSISTGYANVIVTRFNLTPSSAYALTIRNMSGSAQSSENGSITIIYVRTSAIATE